MTPAYRQNSSAILTALPPSLALPCKSTQCRGRKGAQPGVGGAATGSPVARPTCATGLGCGGAPFPPSQAVVAGALDNAPGRALAPDQAQFRLRNRSRVDQVATA